MFSKSIIGAARFLRMPATSRLLYYDLGMQADDDGVVEAFSVMRLTGATEDDLRVLVTKGFVRVLNDDLVTLISDWSKNNLIKKDRYRQSIYKDLIIQLDTNCQRGTQLEPTWNPSGTQLEPQDRLGKDSRGKENIGEENKGEKNRRTSRLPLCVNQSRMNRSKLFTTTSVHRSQSAGCCLTQEKRRLKRDSTAGMALMTSRRFLKRLNQAVSLLAATTETGWPLLTGC